MTIDEATKLIDAITKLMASFVWPALALFIVLRFSSSIRQFVENLGEFSFKGAGIEATAKRKQEAAAALAAAAASHQEPGTSPEASAEKARLAAEVVAEVTPRLIRRARRATVLWVDDKPSNNINERRALEALGVNIVTSLSTDDALKKLKDQSFDAIISDMARPDDPSAGYTLLKLIRDAGNQTPFIIYSGTRSTAFWDEARRRGAMGSTNSPHELFEMVLSALGRSAPP